MPDLGLIWEPIGLVVLQAGAQRVLCVYGLRVPLMCGLICLRFCGYGVGAGCPLLYEGLKHPERAKQHLAFLLALC